MVRAPCCEKEGVKKGPWTPEEDQVLVAYVQQHGHDNWRKLPKKAGLLRCGKSCRLRWTNYLRPDIKRGNFTKEEEAAIIDLHEQLGNRWSAIAGKLPGRTDNEIKNVWHTHLKKTAGVGGAPPEHKRKVKRSTGATNKKKRKDAAMPTKPQAIRPLEAAAAVLQPDAAAAAAAAAGAQDCTSPAAGPASPSSSLCSVISYASSSGSYAGAGATEALMDSLEAFLDVEDVIVDESFWSEAYLSLDSSSSTGADMMSDWTSTMTTSLASPFDESMANCGGGGGGIDDEMGYWLKVFMEAGDMTHDLF